MKEKGFKVFGLQMLILIIGWMSYQMSAYAIETGTVSGMSAKVYKSMNEDSAVVANVIRDSEFIILSMETDEVGIEWYVIRTDTGKIGYIKREEVYREEIDTQDIEQTTKTQIRFRKNVNIRKLPTKDSEIVGRVPETTILEPIQRQENEVGETWYQIEYEEISGYILETTVEIIEIEQEAVLPENELQSQDEEMTVEEVSSSSIQYEEREHTLLERQGKKEANDKIEKKEVAYNKTTRKQVSPIDKVVVILAVGMVCSMLPVIFIVTRIRGKRHKRTGKYKK